MSVNVYCVGGYFQRINHESNTIETAYKKYQSQSFADTEIWLVGLTHLAIPQYYNQVGQLLENNVVIYELFGSSLEKAAKTELLAQGLSPDLQERFTKAIATNYMPDALGRIPQKVGLKYANCRELIHGDGVTEDEESVDDSNPEDEMDSLIEWINDNTRQNLTELNIEIKDDDEINKKLDAFMILKVSKYSRLELSQQARKNIYKADLDVDLIRLDLCPANLDESESEEWRHICRSRSMFVFTRLWPILRRPVPPRVIVVTYGSVHMPYIEENILKQLGFRLKSEDWLVATYLLPRFDIKKHWRNLAQKEYKITYLNEDGNIIFHLIGNPSQDERSQFFFKDIFFVQEALSAAMQNQIGSRTYEVAYSPYSFSHTKNMLERWFCFKQIRKRFFLRFVNEKIKLVGQRIVW